MMTNDKAKSQHRVSNEEPKRRPETASTLTSLIFETVGLFHRLVFVHEEMHGMPPSKRGLLMCLGQFGPQTVPQLARTRPVTRQYIQKVVNQLHDDGLVEFVENPSHKRSVLVRLTKSGGDVLERVQRRESHLFHQVVLNTDIGELETTTTALRSLREFFEGTKWQELISDDFPKQSR